MKSWGKSSKKGGHFSSDYLKASTTNIILMFFKMIKKGFMEDCPSGRMDREKMRRLFIAIMPKVVERL